MAINLKKSGDTLRAEQDWNPVARAARAIDEIQTAAGVNLKRVAEHMALVGAERPAPISSPWLARGVNMGTGGDDPDFEALEAVEIFTRAGGRGLWMEHGAIALRRAAEDNKKFAICLERIPKSGGVGNVLTGGLALVMLNMADAESGYNDTTGEWQGPDRRARLLTGESYLHLGADGDAEVLWVEDSEDAAARLALVRFGVSRYPPVHIATAGESENELLGKWVDSVGDAQGSESTYVVLPT